MMLQTEYEFTLPKGYVDAEGNLHKQGLMRLATAADEILPLKDPRVQNNPSYLTVIVLARVITRLGNLQDKEITPGVIEKLFVEDLGYLQELYRSINGDEQSSRSIDSDGTIRVKTKCPHCDAEVEVSIAAPGE